MQLLPDVEVRCPVCHGRGFTRETLALRYREHDISQALDLTVEEALALFKAADWVIDLGPEGGAAGGTLIAEGTPEQIAETRGSYTGQSLRELL